MSDDSDFEKPASPDVTIVYTDAKTFDINAGETWIYPVNFPIRDYQFNIVQKALYHNTLVSLPTGLGKTFIAAVVMYNFYRWYPRGKILFLAPTRPLVKQQMDACYNITAIPKSTTAELTGHTESKSRQVWWHNKRVFFITPQVLQNDLDTVEGLGANVRCIVFDEAHKARGNHAYVEVIKKLVKLNNFFRVLALSATPGKDIGDTTAVIQNLLISHLEFRTEESSDVQKYVFQRTLETMIVPLDDKMLEVKNSYLNILEGYTRCLVRYKIIQGNCNTLTKGKIFMTLKDFQVKNNINHPNYGEILRNLNVCVTLYHAYELLIRHGLRSFVSYFDEHLDKPLLRGNMGLKDLVKSVKNHLNPTGHLDNSCISRFMVGHPKFRKLREILLAHFTEKQEETRVIVFFEYRESAKEANSILLKDEPVIRSRIFLGQSSGMSQKEQLTVVKAFKEGKCNTLLSTCIGEEGLDVGEVDLIICFDISNRSPIRMIQRIGRTGRKRNGHIIVLVTQGREQQTLDECLQQKKSLPANINALPIVKNMLYTNCPRMIPDDITPRCEKVYFTVKKNIAQTNKLTIVDMFESNSNPCLENIDEIDEGITYPQNENLWNKSNPLECINQSSITCNTLDAIRRLNFCSEIGHSKTSQILISLLQFADCTRFSIPLSPRSLPKKTLVQGDIRDIFKPSQRANTNCEIPVIDNCCNKNFGQDMLEDSISDEVYAEIARFLKIRATLQSTVDLYQDFVKYSVMSLNNINLNTWVEPNLSVLSRITRNEFLKLVKSNNDDKIIAKKELTYAKKDCSKSIYSQKIYYANNKSFNKTADGEIIEILNFFKLVNLEDIFNIPKWDDDEHKENNIILNTGDFSSESTWLAKFNPASHIKIDKNKLCYGETTLNLTRKASTSFDISQDILSEFNDFVDVEDMFETSSKLMSVTKNDTDISKVSKDYLGISPLHQHVHNVKSSSSKTSCLNNKNISEFSHSGLFGGTTRKRKSSVDDEWSFISQTYLNNVQSDCEVVPLMNENGPIDPKRLYLSHEKSSSLCIKNEFNGCKDESQMSITQILSLMDKTEACEELNHDKINNLPNIHLEYKDHFGDLLDKMV